MIFKIYRSLGPDEIVKVTNFLESQDIKIQGVYSGFGGISTDFVVGMKLRGDYKRSSVAWRRR